MPFPQRWADEIFARLAVRYGAAFGAMYSSVDDRVVRADWCDVLDGWERFPAAITWALGNLPEKPLNAIAFRNLCRLAPSAEKLDALPPPKADAEFVSRIMAMAKPKNADLPPRTPAQEVVDGIVERLNASSLRPSMAQLAFVETCSRVLRHGDPRIEQLRAMGFRLSDREEVIDV